jgi:hypothetical protein
VQAEFLIQPFIRFYIIVLSVAFNAKDSLEWEIVSTIWPLGRQYSSGHEQQINFLLLLLDGLASLVYTLEASGVAVHEANLPIGVDLAEFLDDFGRLLLIATNEIHSR